MSMNRFLKSSALCATAAVCVVLMLGCLASLADDAKNAPTKEDKSATQDKTQTENSGSESADGLEDSQAAKTVDSSKLAKDLIGTWVLETAATPGKPSGVGKRLKFFTGTHWIITQPDDRGRVIFHHGGTYEIKGSTLDEKITFAGESTANLIGHTTRLTISVDGDTMKQVGTDSSHPETWKRAK